MLKRLIVVVFALFAFTAHAAVLSLNYTKDLVSIKGKIQVAVSDFKANSQYLQLKIDNCVLTGAVGQPELPVFSELVTLPETGNYIVSAKEIKYEEILLSKD